MTFVDPRGAEQRRRVLVVRDAEQQLRAVFADASWAVRDEYRPGSGYVGLLVSQMPETTRFELVESQIDLVIDEQSQAVRRPLRDTDGQPIRPGKYALSKPGDKRSRTVQVVEDQLVFDLWLVVKVDGDEVRQRIDELSGDVLLQRLGDA